jgi:hypothetical protein
MKATPSKRNSLKVDSRLKEYWAKRGPKPLFGYNWRDRMEMDRGDAVRLFDQVWRNDIEPDLLAAPIIPANQANGLLPQNDKRKNYFIPGSEHRVVEVLGEQLLVQIDRKRGVVDQMWDLRAKFAAPVASVPAAPPSTVPQPTNAAPDPTNAASVSNPLADDESMDTDEDGEDKETDEHDVENEIREEEDAAATDPAEAIEELTPLVKAGNRLAQLAAQYGVPEAELIAAFSVSFAEVLLGR